jgi:hypothetical protein
VSLVIETIQRSIPCAADRAGIAAGTDRFSMPGDRTEQARAST